MYVPHRFFTQRHMAYTPPSLHYANIGKKWPSVVLANPLWNTMPGLCNSRKTLMLSDCQQNISLEQFYQGNLDISFKCTQYTRPHAHNIKKLAYLISSPRCQNKSGIWQWQGWVREDTVPASQLECRNGYERIQCLLPSQSDPRHHLRW